MIRKPESGDDIPEKSRINRRGDYCVCSFFLKFIDRHLTAISPDVHFSIKYLKVPTTIK